MYLKEFKNPVVVDNKKDVNDIIKKISQADLLDEFTLARNDSAWKFWRFLAAEFRVYEMNTSIGKINELPIHIKTGFNL